MVKAKKSKVLLICIICMLVMGISSVGAAGGQEEGGQDAGGKQERVFINVGTGQAGGTYFPVGTGIAQLWNQYADINVQASAMETAGTVDNMALLEKKDIDFAIGVASMLADGYYGRGEFEENDSFKAVIALWPNVFQVLVQPNINDISDLEGKRFGVGAVNSGTEVDSHRLLSTFGLNYRDESNQKIKPEYIPYGESADALKNGTIHGALNVSYPPASSIADLIASSDCKILDFKPDKVEKLLEAYPDYLVPYTIPEGKYHGQDYEVNTVGAPTMLAVRADLPEDVVYELFSAMMENLDYLHDVHSATKEISLERGTMGIEVPFHEGAIKYYKEKGAWKD